ncbi:hypothetical protein AQF98_07000 [Pedobacter sp. Hv1]|nr:hypothetical protein AQF98_07000 [Pedobacter sp. Hv1]
MHYCGDKTVNDFLIGKNEEVIDLFNHFILRYREIGEIKLQATKSMIAIMADQRFAYIIKIGKDFIDIVLPFKKPFEDNLCFRKIALVPGSTDYNHHLRLYYPDDINEEVFDYMKLAYANGKSI